MDGQQFAVPAALAGAHDQHSLTSRQPNVVEVEVERDRLADAEAGVEGDQAERPGLVAEGSPGLPATSG